jgi:hypothetical protein
MKRKADPPASSAGAYEIVIAEDGRVIFRTATAEMMELARTLAPDDPQLRRRGQKRRAAAEGNEDEIRATGRD